MTLEPAEVPLLGGRANVGSVVRIGDQVARPAHPQSPFVDDFLRHLRAKGLTSVPAPLGRDERGRQRLSFIPGIAATPPYPAWAFADDLLVDVVGLQTELQRAGTDYKPPPNAEWATSGGDYFPASSSGVQFCHNDFSMSNVIVETIDGRPTATAVVDFDYVAPVDPLFDIAVLARHWVPFVPEGTVECAEGAIELDLIGRFTLIADAHGLSARQRGRVIDLAIDFLDLARRNVRRLAEQGNPGFAEMIAGGYEQTNEATVEWIRHHGEQLAR